jgi:hypothetical protein
MKEKDQCAAKRVTSNGRTDRGGDPDETERAAVERVAVPAPMKKHRDGLSLAPWGGDETPEGATAPILI